MLFVARHLDAVPLDFTLTHRLPHVFSMLSPLPIWMCQEGVAYRQYALITCNGEVWYFPRMGRLRSVMPNIAAGLSEQWHCRCWRWSSTRIPLSITKALPTTSVQRRAQLH